MMGKHHAIVVFSKLLSFTSAHESVHRSLKTIIDNDECLQNRVEVIDYSEYQGRTPSFPVCTVTGVVVIDARQTRTLITPHRRDPNVDHWNELEMLQNTITKPKGSILVVIYGDENSKHLRKGLVSEKWKMVWKFNDEIAFSLARKNRCFSVWENFNECQRTEIARYITLLPLIPVYKGKTRLAVLTEGVSYTIHDNYLAYHPLLSSEIQLKERRSDGLSVHSVFDLTFDSHSERRKRIEVYHKYYDDISELLQNDSSEIQADKQMTNIQPYDMCVVMCKVSNHYKNEIDKKLKNAVAEILHLNPSSMCCRLMPVFNEENRDYFKDIFIPSLKRSIQNTIWQTEKLSSLDTLSRRDLQMIYGLHKCYTTKALGCISEMCCGQCIALLGKVSKEEHRTLELFEKNIGPFNKEEVTVGRSQTVTATPYTIYNTSKLTILDFTVKENGQQHKYDEIFLQQISGGKISVSKKKSSIESYWPKNLPSIGRFLPQNLPLFGSMSTGNCTEIQAIVYVRHHGSGYDESLRTFLEFQTKANRIPIFLFYESALGDEKSKDHHAAKDNADKKEQLTEKEDATCAVEADGDADNTEQSTDKGAVTGAVEREGDAAKKEQSKDKVAAAHAVEAMERAMEADGNADNREQSTDEVTATRVVEADGYADNTEQATDKMAATSAVKADDDADNNEQSTDKVAVTRADDFKADINTNIGYYNFLLKNFSFVLNDKPTSDKNLRTLYEVLNLSKEFYDSQLT